MLIRSITQNAMDKNFSIRQFPSPEHPYIAFPQKNLAVLDISRFTTGEIGPQSRLRLSPNHWLVGNLHLRLPNNDDDDSVGLHCPTILTSNNVKQKRSIV